MSRSDGRLTPDMRLAGAVNLRLCRLLVGKVSECSHVPLSGCAKTSTSWSLAEESPASGWPERQRRGVFALHCSIGAISAPKQVRPRRSTSTVEFDISSNTTSPSCAKACVSDGSSPSVLHTWLTRRGSSCRRGAGANRTLRFWELVLRCTTCCPSTEIVRRLRHFAYRILGGCRKSRSCRRCRG